MLFVEFRFFVFYAIVFSVMWTLPWNAARKVWLLLCSHFFYACFFIGPPLDFLHELTSASMAPAARRLVVPARAHRLDLHGLHRRPRHRRNGRSPASARHG